MAISLILSPPLTWCADPPGAPGGPDGRSTLARDDEPVSITGSMLPDFLSLPIDEIALFRYEDSTAGFVPVPFQIDERVDRVFNEGTPGEFRETVYDVMGEDDGLLDEDDEIVLLFADTGELAPTAAPWLEGADGVRFGVEVRDTRAGAPKPTGWVYVFSGPDLPRSAVQYVIWDGQATSSIVTDTFAMDFEDRWLLTGFRLFSPCGDGSDLIDRLKGRAVPLGESEEDEESWNLNSEYLGGMAGPVRAIRYVRGARSGINTIHHDLVYHRFWTRRINLRVHPIQDATLYVDWLPLTGATLYTELEPSGVPVDGVPDPVSTSWVDWALLRSAEGGFVIFNDIPPSPLYQGREFFYLDDASHDDAVPANPDYGDDDDSAIGNMGVRLTDISGSNLQEIPMTYWVYPLCAEEGDLEFGNAFEELHDQPLQVDSTPQWRGTGAVRTLAARRDGDDVVLDWEQIPLADTYRVYSSEFPDLPPVAWDLEAEIPATTFTDPAAAAYPASLFYSVTAVNQAGEGPW